MKWLFFLQIGGGQNTPAAVTHVSEEVIQEGRELRVQPFNQYRKRFNLKPYTSFFELTGKKKSVFFKG